MQNITDTEIESADLASLFDPRDVNSMLREGDGNRPNRTRRDSRGRNTARQLAIRESLAR